LTGLISNNVECSGREAAQENYSCDTAFSIEFRDHSDYSRGRGGGGGGGGRGGDKGQGGGGGEGGGKGGGDPWGEDQGAKRGKEWWRRGEGEPFAWVYLQNSLRLILGISNVTVTCPALHVCGGRKTENAVLEKAEVLLLKRKQNEEDMNVQKETC